MYFSLQKPMNNTATYLLIQWLVQEFCINFAIFPNLCTPMCIFSAFFYQICTSCFSACLRIAKLPFYSSAGVGEGWSAAHKNFRLLLLPSGPDKVHGIPLRRTQTIPGEAIKGQSFSFFIKYAQLNRTYYYMGFGRDCQMVFEEIHSKHTNKQKCRKNN